MRDEVLDRFLAIAAAAIVATACLAARPAAAQTPDAPQAPAPSPSVPPAPAPAAPAQPAATEGAAPADAAATSGVEGAYSDYHIGPGDVLAIVFWRDRELSGEVTVRPDGMVTLPLLNDVLAAGLTPNELRLKVTEGARRFVTEPTASVVVRQIHSRNVYITGQVIKPGPYPLYGPMRVLQLIAAAGGLREFADSSKIVIVRNEGSAQSSLNFNYKDVVNRRSLAQNVELRPGDTVVVP